MLFRVIGCHKADIGEVAIALGVIHSVTDDEEIGDGEADIIGLNLFDSTRRLVKQGSDAPGFGPVLQKYLAQIRKSQAGVEDVFDDQHVFAFDGFIEVLDKFDRTGGALTLAVARYGDEVKRCITLNGPREIREEESCTLEDADHDDLLP